MSVLIACFNDGATVGETVASVTTRYPVEIIVIDDGSSDPQTVATIDALAGREGVRVVRQANGGLSSARMAGFRISRGQYVFPLDADDRLLPGGLDALVAYLDEHPQLGLCWGDLLSFGEIAEVFEKANDLDPWTIRFLNELPVCSLIRREVVADSGGWRRQGYEDWDLWMTLAERGIMGARIPVAVVHYRIHGRRMTAEFRPQMDAIWAEMRDGHPGLFCREAHSWRESSAPLFLRAWLSLCEQLPVGRSTKMDIDAFGSHLVHRRPLGSLARRILHSRRRSSRPFPV